MVKPIQLQGLLNPPPHQAMVNPIQPQGQHYPSPHQPMVNPAQPQGQLDPPMVNAVQQQGPLNTLMVNPVQCILNPPLQPPMLDPIQLQGPLNPPPHQTMINPFHPQGLLCLSHGQGYLLNTWFGCISCYASPSMLCVFWQNITPHSLQWLFHFQSLFWSLHVPTVG